MLSITVGNKRVVSLVVMLLFSFPERSGVLLVNDICMRLYFGKLAAIAAHYCSETHSLFVRQKYVYGTAGSSAQSFFT